MGDFDAGGFDGRLRFRKTARVLQSFCIDLGCRRNRCLRGPHCPDLAKAGFGSVGAAPELPYMPAGFGDGADQTRHADFESFVTHGKNGPDALEIASSTRFPRNGEGSDERTAPRPTGGERARFATDERRGMRDEPETRDAVEGRARGTRRAAACAGSRSTTRRTTRPVFALNQKSVRSRTTSRRPETGKPLRRGRRSAKP